MRKTQGRLGIRLVEELAEPGSEAQLASYLAAFDAAQAQGFDGIELVYDHAAAAGLLQQTEGRRALRRAAQDRGLALLSLYAENFVSAPLGEQGTLGRRAAEQLIQLVRWSAELGAARVHLPLPLLTAASYSQTLPALVSQLRLALPSAEAYQVELACELAPLAQDPCLLFRALAHPQVVAAGSAAQLLYQPCGRDAPLIAQKLRLLALEPEVQRNWGEVSGQSLVPASSDSLEESRGPDLVLTALGMSEPRSARALGAEVLGQVQGRAA